MKETEEHEFVQRTEWGATLMGKDSKIAWTDHTFNPWWGCTRASEECLHCYAETFAKRCGHNVFGVDKLRRFFSDKHWNEPLAWNAAARTAGERHRVFCMSMGDLFEDRPDLVALRARTFDLIAKTPNLDWLICTKRAENLSAMLPTEWLKEPQPNVWLLVTAGNSARLLERWGYLSKIPAVVRGISAEPLLGPLQPALRELVDTRAPLPDWMIVGGESGPGARCIGGAEVDPTDEDAVASVSGEVVGGIQGACKALRIAFFMKQWGAVVARHAHFKDRRAGADPAEWPPLFRVRDLPEARR